jgi:hypothetical protein
MEASLSLRLTCNFSKTRGRELIDLTADSHHGLRVQLRFQETRRKGEGVGAGGEMAQTMYTHMNK